MPTDKMRWLTSPQLNRIWISLNRQQTCSSRCHSPLSHQQEAHCRRTSATQPTGALITSRRSLPIVRCRWRLRSSNSSNPWKYWRGNLWMRVASGVPAVAKKEPIKRSPSERTASPSINRALRASLPPVNSSTGQWGYRHRVRTPWCCNQQIGLKFSLLTTLHPSSVTNSFSNNSQHWCKLR